MRNNLDDPSSKDSELKKWLLLNGIDCVKKFIDFEKSGYKKKLTFSSIFYILNYLQINEN